MRRELQFFVTGKIPPGGIPYADPGFIGGVDTLEAARYRKKELEKWGYTDVAIWERLDAVKVG